MASVFLKQAMVNNRWALCTLPDYSLYFHLGRNHGWRCFTKRSKSWLSRVKNVAQNILAGDDHINPKKILERKYIFYALLALQLRDLRRLPRREESERLDDDSLYEKATDTLERKGIDKMRNVELRIEMQTMLQPQIKTIFDSFHRVDERLGLSMPLEDDRDTSLPAFPVEIEALRPILTSEAENTAERLAEPVSRSNHSNHFLTTKLEAIDVLMDFHGWSDHQYNASSNANENGLDPFGMDVSERSDSTIKLIRQHQTLNMCRSAMIREDLGYSVISLRSFIDGGGRGLFVDGTALPGSIVAFQPGEVWPKEHMITNAPEVMEHFDGEDDCQISIRFDEYVVDSRHAPVTVLTQEGSMNPWALGNMVNHPNDSTLPNCQSTMLNFMEQANLEQKLKYVPNSYARPPSWQSSFFDPEVLMHGLCLLSRRDVCDEELVYDYRLQSEELPDWYSVVSYGDGFEDEQVVFFKTPRVGDRE